MESAARNGEVAEYCVDVPEEDAPVLTLYGAGAEEWLKSNSFADEGDGTYMVTDEALYALPEGLTLGDDEMIERWHALNVDFVSVRTAETEAAP